MTPIPDYSSPLRPHKSCMYAPVTLNCVAKEWQPTEIMFFFACVLTRLAYFSSSSLEKIKQRTFFHWRYTENR